MDLAGAEGEALAAGGDDERRPRSSTPSANPEPRSQTTSRPTQRVAFAPGGRGCPLARSASSQCSSRSAEGRRAPQRGRRWRAIPVGSNRDVARLAQLARGNLPGDREVKSDPDAPPSRPAGGPRSGSRRAFVPSRRTSLGHLTPHSIPGPQRLGRLADGERNGEREQRAAARRAGASDRRVEQSAAGVARVQVRPWRPRPALCSAAVTTVPCGAPAAASSRARDVGRVGPREMPVRRRRRMRSPSLRLCVGEQGGEEAVDVVALGFDRDLKAGVAGGLAGDRADRDDTRRWRGSARRAASVRLRTVEEEVKVT